MTPERPAPDAARAALDQIADSRRAVARVTRRPAWLDAGLALATGAAIAAALAGHRLVALGILIAGAVAFAVVRRTLARRRGQVQDQRALGARALRFLPLYAILMVLMLIDPPLSWQPWWPVLVGAVVAIGGFAWLRWAESYEERCLAEGDHGPHDLL